MTNPNQPNQKLLVDGSRGVYVPNNFIRRFDYTKWGIPAEDAVILRNDVDDWRYWECWVFVLQMAQYTDDDGVVWHLHQDGEGNLWAYSIYFDETASYAVG